MIESGDLRKGSKVLIDSYPYTVLEAEHVKPGKGSAFARCKLKNLQTGQLLERTFKSNESFEEPNLEHLELQYLYAENGMFYFMNNENYEQVIVNGVELLIAKSSLPFIQGVTLDYVEMEPGDMRFIFIPLNSAQPS